MATCRLTHHRAGVNAISDEGRINLCSGVRCDLLLVRVSRSERVFLSCQGGGGGIRTTSDTIDRKQKRLVVPIAYVCGCLLCDPVALFVYQRLHLA